MKIYAIVTKFNLKFDTIYMFNMQYIYIYVFIEIIYFLGKMSLNGTRGERIIQII